MCFVECYVCFDWEIDEVVWCFVEDVCEWCFFEVRYCFVMCEWVGGFRWRFLLVGCLLFGRYVGRFWCYSVFCLVVWCLDWWRNVLCCCSWWVVSWCWYWLFFWWRLVIVCVVLVDWRCCWGLVLCFWYFWYVLGLVYLGCYGRIWRFLVWCCCELVLVCSNCWSRNWRWFGGLYW